MSQEYMVLLVPEPTGYRGVDGSPAEVWMRFTEEPPASLLTRLAVENPGKRVYCLLGASTWYSDDALREPEA